jgi:energy-coupling factor transporter ATP-binding protein EcfA2
MEVPEKSEKHVARVPEADDELGAGLRRGPVGHVFSGSPLGELAWRETTAELTGSAVAVRMAEVGPCTILAVEGHGTWRVDRTTGQVEVVEPAADAQAAALALDGPVRLHMLAERGVHVLHASAIAASNGGLVALTAPSGVGKSTFAACAHALGRERAADDLLPIALAADGRFVARPHFPQPKLSPDEQYPHDAPNERSLAALVRLERGEVASWTRLSARAAMELALRSTVATRVYSKAALAAHLSFCQRFGEAVGEGRIACGVLTVPHRPEAIETAVREALDALDAALRI